MEDNYLDGWGLPGSITRGRIDGGDAAAILGTLAALDPDFEDSRALLFHFGIPIRHPDTRYWYSDTNRFSRDQLKASICGYIYRPSVMGDVLFRAHMKHQFLYAWNRRANGSFMAPKQRPDITGPSVWALWLRYKRPWWRHAVLWLLDLELLGSAVHWRFWRKDRVSRNHMLASVTCYEHSPTLTSWLAFKLNDWDDLVGRWAEHCRIVQEYPTAHLFAARVAKLKH